MHLEDETLGKWAKEGETGLTHLQLQIKEVIILTDPTEQTDTQEDSSYPRYKLLTSSARLPISLQF